MALDFQVLSLGDLDEVYAFAERRLERNEPDPSARMFAAWNARWRKEALTHYLPLGWSFIARENGRTVGFFLGQPFLFFRGQTQTLWIELVEAETEEARAALVDVAVRVAREKHLQRALFAEGSKLQAAFRNWATAPLNDDIIEVRTTKG